MRLTSHCAAWHCSRCMLGSLSDPSQIEEQVSLWPLSMRTRSTGLLSKGALRSSSKCSDGSHMFLVD